MPAITRALVTGASAGIGESFARQLAAQGAALVLVARRTDRLDALAARLREGHGIEVETLAADLSTPEGVQATADRLAADPAIDLLVNNAGYAARGRVGQLDAEALDHMLRVNVLALARLSHAAMGAMTPRGHGAVVNVASGTVFMQFPGNAGYGASKNFVMGFTRNMQVEAQGTGIQVQLLIPGVIATDFHAVAGNSLSNFPPERVMQADELVAASLRALEMREPVCIPSLPDIRDWEAYVAAEARVAAGASRDRAADRYGLPR
ncbi:Short-chain dehydrogenase/reductase SDR [Rubellimicrobium mesophilum DSM 19309]|uniref:NADP-dependent 3-hydroxy acid dehydrogenase YdfG n=1 Tax=Rubellimicrobium mesophilum DSM 19309 TaxID=442562 RepID=A0A017HBR0_9RHOB|nr:SDR family NAD(P)-dependent oxidoreductase [Rubellimicrobium mesophilum]EYD71543.1 Short-chain dehydrogenase/reductase SDR [Rubellimicrobium mesophilum DSM 19309]